MRISAIILTYNEELHIERCINNLQRVCEKIFVVDSFSTDQTCAIAERNGAIVLQNKYVNQAQQFQWALDNCEVMTEWTLRMDADEYLTDELLTEIESTLPNLSTEIAGCYLPLRVVFMGKMLKHGLPHQIQLLRLWRTGSVYMEQRWMDERCVLTQGKPIYLKNSFVDHNLKGLGEFTIKHNYYSSREVVTQLDKKYHLFENGESDELKGRNQQKNFYYWMPKFLRAMAYFCVRYFVFLGFLDGIRGFIWLTLQAYWYRFLVDAKLYEMQKTIGKNPTKEQVVEYIKNYYRINIE